MQLSTKIKTSAKWIFSLGIIAMSFVACNDSTDGAKDSKDTMSVSAPAPMTDTLPPIDTSATPRPEDGKTLQ